MTQTSHRTLLIAALALGVSVPGCGHAQDETPALDRIDVSLGGYDTNVDTRLSGLAPDAPLNGTIDMEQDLGLPSSKTVPRARINLLLGEHEGLALDYYRLHRQNTMTLVRDIGYDGATFHASAQARSRLNFGFGSVAWRWWLGRGRDAFGLGLGGAWYQVRAAISAQATVTGPITESVGTSAASNLEAWAPMLQLGWRHAFNDKWRMFADASGVKKNGGALSGHIYNLALGVAWYPWKHAGFAAEYDYSNIRLFRSLSDYDLRLRMKLQGPSVYAVFRW